MVGQIAGLCARLCVCNGLLGELGNGRFRVEFAPGAGRDRMIAELEADHDLFTRTDRAVQAAVAHIIPKLGIDLQTHRAQMDAITKSLLDEARAKAAAD